MGKEGPLARGVAGRDVQGAVAWNPILDNSGDERFAARRVVCEFVAVPIMVGEGPWH